MGKITSTIRLKTLTEKSLIPIGKVHRTETVGDLIESKRYEYLRYLYYTVSKLTFIDTVLEKIGITSDNKIEKPGIHNKCFKSNTNN